MSSSSGGSTSGQVQGALQMLSEGTADVWDMTLPWARIYWEIDVLKRYHECGYTFANLTIQDMPATYNGVLQHIADFQAMCEPHSDWLCFGSSIAEIDEGRRAGKLVLGINVQDTVLVHEDLGRLQTLKDLGVRHMLLAYQTRNLAADGCAEPADAGLSFFGRSLVREMNRVGMIVDVSHVGRQSSLDAIEVSELPVIFSHSGARAVCTHIRNIDDDQIKACAGSGGVVGVVGIGAFLGDPEARTETVFRHIDHVVQLVGPEFAGIGTDFINDMTPTWEGVRSAMDTSWRDPFGTQLYEGVAFAPEQLVPLAEMMAEKGYDDDAILGILGANFRRVFETYEAEDEKAINQGAGA